jgi:hypothetical protein
MKRVTDSYRGSNLGLSPVSIVCPLQIVLALQNDKNDLIRNIKDHNQPNKNINNNLMSKSIDVTAACSCCYCGFLAKFFFHQWYVLIVGCFGRYDIPFCSHEGRRLKTDTTVIHQRSCWFVLLYAAVSLLLLLSHIFLSFTIV